MAPVPILALQELPYPLQVSLFFAVLMVIFGVMGLFLFLFTILFPQPSPELYNQIVMGETDWTDESDDDDDYCPFRAMARTARHLVNSRELQVRESYGTIGCNNARKDNKRRSEKSPAWTQQQNMNGRQYFDRQTA